MIFPMLIVFVFVLGYLAIVFEHTIAINKTASALLTAVVVWVLISVMNAAHPQEAFLHLSEHLADIAQIVVFLLGAMSIVELISAYDGFRIITDSIRTRNRRSLLWILAVITFFTSAVLDNLTTSIVMISLLRRLVDDKHERMIFACMVILAANAGGAWSPIGDVTTTMLWIDQRVSTWNLISLLFVPSAISLIIPLLFFTFQLKNDNVVPPPQTEQKPLNSGARRVFYLGVGALVFVPVLRALTGLPPYMGILLGLGVMWALTDRIHQERHYLRIPHVLTKIDLSSVLFFLGILLAIAGLETAGLLGQLARWMDANLGNKDVIVAVMGIASAVIDNVPLTAATMGMYPLEMYPTDAKIWQAIAYAVGTGGSLLIIGSAAGVVVMGMEHIRFSWYLKKVTLPGLVGYLAGFFAFLFIYRIFG